MENKGAIKNNYCIILERARKMVKENPPQDWKKEYYQKVWDIVRRVPVGKVITYGGIAAEISSPSNINPSSYFFLAPLWVGKALSECPNDVPWHRVINSKGEISYRKGDSFTIQKELLIKEGVKFESNGKINQNIFGWKYDQSIRIK